MTFNDSSVEVFGTPHVRGTESLGAAPGHKCTISSLCSVVMD